MEKNVKKWKKKDSFRNLSPVCMHRGLVVRSWQNFGKWACF